MRPIGIDELSVVVEAAQCGPDECLMVDAYHHATASKYRQYVYPPHALEHGLYHGMGTLLGIYVVPAPEHYYCNCGRGKCDHCTSPADQNAPQEYWTMRIAIWPDGEWCNLDDVEEFMREQGMDDNYATFTAANDDEAERLAARIAAQGA